MSVNPISQGITIVTAIEMVSDHKHICLCTLSYSKEKYIYKEKYKYIIYTQRERKRGRGEKERKRVLDRAHRGKSTQTVTAVEMVSGHKLVCQCTLSNAKKQSL